ncbi:MAG: right-handed parallel beta-helix repeat-containing protein [Ruminococcus sp.]|nr:right-handed parallel beta-helix repeat-containing protein [Candidatus Copronaster equi]
MGIFSKTFAMFLSIILTLNSNLPLPLKFLNNIVRDYAKNVYTVRESAPSNLSTYTKSDYPLVENADFYVSVDGSDENDGSFSAPFATIEKARDEVRKLDKSLYNSITVAIKAGDYRVSSLDFNMQDSGTENCPITYCAYGDGEVILNGGISINGNDFKKVTDKKMLSRLSKNAKKDVVCLDLADYGVTAEQYGKIYAIGTYNTAKNYDGDYVGDLYCELFVNDIRQNIARYPNDEYLYTDKVVKTGLGRESNGAETIVPNWDSIRNPESDVYKISKKLAKRIEGWEALDDVWMFGFWKYDWADASSPIGYFDFDKRELSPKFVSMYGTKKNAPYYFFNVFEELDAPGEWYLDRNNGIIYLYSDKNISSSVIDLSLTTKPVLNINNANNITFKGLTIKGTRGDAIVCTGNNNLIELCTLKNIAGNAVYVKGYNNLVSENDISRTGRGGIILDGGDEKTLTPGRNKADNNFIHDWSEIYQTYQPAVTLNGVGNICSHNEMCNSPHEAVTYFGNNHIVEYNNIHDVCLLSDDAGAIYSGRSWNSYGNIIRYNCVYNLGSDGHRPDGIYMDDALSGQTVYGNILVNVPKIGIHLGGGRDLTVKNNIIINTNDRSISYDSRAFDCVDEGWFHEYSGENGEMWRKLYASPWQTEAWKEAFPQMSKISNDFSDRDNPYFAPNPAFSDVSGNIIVTMTCDIGSISDAANEFSTIENNAIFGLHQLHKLFADPDNGDYTLKENSLAYEKLSDVEQIPISEIGRYSSK